MARDKTYYDAEKRIEEARRPERQSLNLRNLHLTKLPELLGEFTHLRSLNLPGNRLTTLPEWLGQGSLPKKLDTT